MRTVVTKGFLLSCFSVVLLMTVAVTGRGQEIRDCVTYVEEAAAATTSFVLIVDRSGSMTSDNAMQRTINALQQFIRRMRPGDEAAIVSFASDVSVDQGFTPDKERLVQAAGELRANGMTRLNDAIAAGARLASGRSGNQVLVVFTDGTENQSTLSARDVRHMNIRENALTYTLGIGDVDHRALEQFARSTGGIYQYAARAIGVEELYDRVQQHFYERHDSVMQDRGGLTVTSFPAGRTVLIDGQQVGTTPIRLNDLNPGASRVEVLFDRGSWLCTTQVIAGARGYVSARERDLPLNLTIETAPARAAIFVDDDYVGMSSMVPSFVVEGERDVSKQLTIPSIPPGTHRIRVVAAPEYDFSPNQSMEFDVTIRDSHEYVKALIFLNTLEDIEGNQRRIAPGSPPASTGSGTDDPFSRVLGGGNGPPRPTLPQGLTGR
jgi:hypothetical protein